MNTHTHAVAVVRPVPRTFGARATRMVAKLTLPLLAAVTLLACAPIPSSSTPSGGATAGEERRAQHWEVDGLQRSGNHGGRRR